MQVDESFPSKVTERHAAGGLKGGGGSRQTFLMNSLRRSPRKSCCTSERLAVPVSPERRAEPAASGYVRQSHCLSGALTVSLQPPRWSKLRRSLLAHLHQTPLAPPTDHMHMHSAALCCCVGLLLRAWATATPRGGCKSCRHLLHMVIYCCLNI